MSKLDDILLRFLDDHRSNSALAALTGIPRTTIRDLRSGKTRFPAFRALSKIMRLYGKQ